MVIITLAIGCLVAAVVLLAVVLGRSPQATGVPRSLELIELTAGDRQVLRNELPARDRLVTPFFDKLRAMAVVLSPEGTTTRLGRMIDRAGNPSGWSVDRILGLKGACLLLGAALGLFYGGGLAVAGVLLAVALGTGLFWVPDLLLYNVAIKRQEQAGKGLAEAMDMLTVCVEAGQGFDAALTQVARNIEGPISGEFTRAMSEVQMGRTRGEAFSGLADRIDTPEVRNFVTALVQADRLGLPIAQVLREQTKAMRLARKQRAEEQAQKVTVKILFPLMVCILPALFVVVIGPGAIRMAETFSQL